jgi:hypothetical protein
VQRLVVVAMRAIDSLKGKVFIVRVMVRGGLEVTPESGVRILEHGAMRKVGAWSMSLLSAGMKKTTTRMA